MNKKLLAL
jgi:general secretion pathway protein A